MTKSIQYPLDTVRHSTAHLMAAAIKKLYPGTRFGIGPPVANGFYYDVKLPGGATLKTEDLTALEAEMSKLKQQKLPYTRIEEDIDKTIDRMKKDGQTFKVELLESLKTKGTTSVKDMGDDGLVDGDQNSESGVSRVSLYTIGDIFLDLCRGPHVENTSQCGEFRLHKLAGAYWRGKSDNEMLQRVYALCYLTAKEVQQEDERLKEIVSRDHRTLGQKANIFFFEPLNVGVGLPFWTPRGTILRKELEYLAQEFERKYGYHRVSTPELAREELYYQSGHLPYYSDSMYDALNIEGVKYRLRPMNCPHHHQVFLNEARSYKDLPLRIAEYGQVYRYEDSGSLSGLMRTRGFCQNDAHIYCRYDQAKDVFLEVMRLHMEYYRLFDIKEYYLRLSLPDLTKLDKYVNEPSRWLAALEIVRAALQESGLPYKEVAGEAAFYGPKADFQICNAVGTEFTISTNQLDFFAHEKFKLCYQGSDGKSDHPVYVVHRAPLGSHERFVAFLIEHYKMVFPTWLSLTQVRIVTIHEEFHAYAKKFNDYLFSARVSNGSGGIRVDMDNSTDTFNNKIRKAADEKIPYIVVIGKQEVADKMLSVRLRGNKTIKISPADFLSRLILEIETRTDGIVSAAETQPLAPRVSTFE